VSLACIVHQRSSPTDLIRKHHPHQRQPGTDDQQDIIRHQQPKHDLPKQAPPPQPTPEAPKDPGVSLPEDCEPKAKMPSYKGLENFKLLEKMGESVPFIFFSNRTPYRVFSQWRIFQRLQGDQPRN